MALPFQPNYPIIWQAIGADLDNVAFGKIKNEFVADYAEHQSIATWYEGSSAPLNPVTGQRWKDTSSNPSILKRFNGSTWDVDEIERSLSTSITSLLGILTLTTGKSFIANGSETITSITGWTSGIVFIRWNTVRTLTYNATSLITQSNANRITNQGDVGIYEMTSAGAREIGYFPSSFSGNPTGTPIHVLSKTAPSGYIKANGAAVSRTIYSNLMNNSFCSLSIVGNTANANSTIVNITSTVDLAIGMPVEGAGIPTGATITAINSLTSITISANATATATGVALTVFPYGNGDGSTTYNVPDLRGEHLRNFDDGRNVDQNVLSANISTSSNVITGLSDTKFMFIGMPVSGTNILAGATVASITSATAITISSNATATITEQLTFTGRRYGSFESDDLKAHIHNVSYTSISTSGGGNASVGGSSLYQTTATGGAETRGRNYAFPVYIKY